MRFVLYFAYAAIVLLCTVTMAEAQDAPPLIPGDAVRLPPVKVITPQTLAKVKPADAHSRQIRKPAAVARPTLASPQRPVDLGQDTAADALVSPLSGTGGALSKIPGSAGFVSAQDIARTSAGAPQDALAARLPGVIVSDVQGNPFTATVEYRGFTASPVNGLAQGLAVYQNGVRINEVFGDTVNWDLIPSSAIRDIAVVSGNPIFGLNALGGAVSVTMKDGFSFHGIEADIRGGSFGRVQESLQAGKQYGNFAGYIAIEGVNEAGWRDFSPSQIHRMYADLGVRDRITEMHVNFTGAANSFGVIGPTPVDLLSQRYESVYTNPQTSKNDLGMVSVNGKTTVTDTLEVAGVGYYRDFSQRRVDGNVSRIEGCGGQPTSTGDVLRDFLCLEDGLPPKFPVFDTSGKFIRFRPGTPFNDNGNEIGTIDRTSIVAESEGATLQAKSRAPVFGHENAFIVGASYDHGDVKSTVRSELGTLNLSNLAVDGSGIFLGGVDNRDEFKPVNLRGRTDYAGIYVTDTFDVTRDFAVSAGGRFNHANIALKDRVGDSLNGEHTYTRFNPVIGATYQVSRGMSLYGGYSEANRAPTPAELSCADPARPCLLENFLVSDPDLKQVVSRTVEAGVRGTSPLPRLDGNLSWTAGLFTARNSDDIISVFAPGASRGYFRNAGVTRRQGIEAGASYTNGAALFYANYNYTDATFRSPLELSSPNNPFADANGLIAVKRGDRLPSVPEHRFKVGFDTFVTGQWKVGADLVAASSQFLAADAGNQNRQLPGYAVINLHTSYDIEKNVQIYALVNNVFDKHFATYGTFFDYQSERLAALNFESARTITPAQPLSVYGGLKIKF